MSEEQYQAYNTYSELMGALKSLSREQSSGTMYIATPDNQFARVVLKGGEPVALSFRGKGGKEAVPLIRSIAAGRFKFSPGQTSADADHFVPQGYDVLGALSIAPPELAEINRSLPPDLLAMAPKIAQEELATMLGPIAMFVWEEHMKRFGTPRHSADVHDLLDALGREIGDPIKVRTFKDAVWARLKRD